MKKILAIDIGGTNQRFAWVDEEGHMLQKWTHAHSFLLDSESFFNELEGRIRQYISHDQCIGIGIALPMVMDEISGKIYDAPNLPFLVGVDIKGRLSRLLLPLALPFVLENDANSAALGEAWVGVGRREDSFCVLTLGTGIGGGLVLNKKLWKGVRGMASEIGHIKIDFSGKYPCHCGDHGCLEAFASAAALQKKTGIEPKTLFEMASQGDSNSKKWFSEMGEKLGRGIATVTNLLNIECFVLSGRLSEAFAYFYPSCIRAARESSMKGPGENLRILKSNLGDNAGLLGAAYLARSIQIIP